MFGLGLHKQTPAVFKFIKFVYHEANVLFAFILPDTRVLKLFVYTRFGKATK